MKRLITFITVAIMLQSCAGYDVIPLKGKYENSNTFYFDKNFDEVWNATIEVAMKKGFSIKFLDKASGVITGDKADMYAVSTIEDKKGVIKNKDAYVVTGNLFTGYDNLKPDGITATWNILIRNENNKVSLNVNLFPDAKLAPTTSSLLKNGSYIMSASTGNFEKLIADSLKF